MALTVAEALARILDGAEPTPSHTVPLAEAHGLTLAEPLSAVLTQPPFDASAMDGYAVRRADLATIPARLAVIGEAAAGHPFAGVLGAGEAVRIFTGAPLPAGADAVVIQENAERQGDVVVVNDPKTDGDHVRRRGIDFSAGARLLEAGRRLGPRELSLAAAMGHGAVAVRRRPRVAVIATGDELVLPGQRPGPGQIVASNHLGVAALAEQAGAEASFLGIARDTAESLDEKLDAARDADIVVTIGGASVGDHDLVAQALERRGVALAFWKIAMRPGKPLMFARHAGRSHIGLPGNPVSAIICARIFIVPLISRLLGRAETAHGPQPAQTDVALPANGPREHYMRATFRTGPDGRAAVTPAPSQDSSLLSPLAEANCFLVRPVNAPAVPAGAPVDILPLDF